jgi:hypothetical protein
MRGHGASSDFISRPARHCLLATGRAREAKDPLWPPFDLPRLFPPMENPRPHDIIIRDIQLFDAGCCRRFCASPAVAGSRIPTRRGRLFPTRTEPTARSRWLSWPSTSASSWASWLSSPASWPAGTCCRSRVPPSRPWRPGHVRGPYTLLGRSPGSGAWSAPRPSSHSGLLKIPGSSQPCVAQSATHRCRRVTGGRAYRPALESSRRVILPSRLVRNPDIPRTRREAPAPSVGRGAMPGPASPGRVHDCTHCTS